MDNITIGELNLPIMTFASINYFPNMPTNIQFTSIEGEFGLAPPPKIIDTCISSPLISLMSAVDHPIVTIYTSGVSIGDTNLGSLTFGTENYNDCIGEYDYVSLAEEGEWSVNILSVRVNNTKMNITLSPKLIIMDQALYMYGPKVQMDQLAQMLGATIPDDIGDFYLLNETACLNINLMPTITIRFGEEGKDTSKVILKPDQYMETSPIGECRLLFMTNEIMQYDNDYWVMGQQFLLRRCVSLHFRKGKIGFAEGKNQTSNELTENLNQNDNTITNEDIRILQYIG